MVEITVQTWTAGKKDEYSYSMDEWEAELYEEGVRMKAASIEEKNDGVEKSYFIPLTNGVQIVKFYFPLKDKIFPWSA